MVPWGEPSRDLRLRTFWGAECLDQFASLIASSYLLCSFDMVQVICCFDFLNADRVMARIFSAHFVLSGHCRRQMGTTAGFSAPQQDRPADGWPVSPIILTLVSLAHFLGQQAFYSVCRPFHLEHQAQQLVFWLLQLLQALDFNGHPQCFRSAPASLWNPQVVNLSEMWWFHWFLVALKERLVRPVSSRSSGFCLGFGYEMALILFYQE